MRHYPAISRRFPELAALEQFPVEKANEVRSDAYQSLYEKLSSNDKSLIDRLTRILKLEVSKIGTQGAWELLVAVAQVMEWLDWPKDSPRKENATNEKSHIY